MSKIIKESRRVDSKSHYRLFERKGGSGYSFPCDASGNVDNPSNSNYLFCLSMPEELVDKGVITYENNYREPAELECDCGEVIELTNFTNTCGCGADYNQSGQRLADRSQWGLDTGESLSDILGIP